MKNLLTLTVLLSLVNCANAGDTPPENPATEAFRDIQTMTVTCTKPNGESWVKERVVLSTFKASDKYWQCLVHWDKAEREEEE